MKGTVLFLLCAIVTAHADLDGHYDNGCPKDTSIEKLLPHEQCDQFYQCFHGELIARFCPSGLHYNPDLEKCDWAEEAKCHSKREDSEELDNSNSSHAISICLNSDSNDVLVAHENCNEFYKCSYGKPVALKCAPSLLYNQLSEKCDWPQNVECGERVIPDNDNNYITLKRSSETIDETDSGNSDPSQAPALCAALGSDGVLVAHENCNQFYKCFSGKPVALKCPSNLMYNTNKEYCDWPRNVECADRVIPESDDSNVDGGSPGNNGNSNESEETEIDAGDDSNTGNSDPSQAPAICASINSEGVLVAHESCNQFYKCSGGYPVPLLCPGILLFNPSKNYCDWPHNFDCGDRIIPDGNDSGSDSNDNDNVTSPPPPEESGNNHYDPSQAPTICAALNSDGVLVAHENCNKFYKCFEGHPVALKCPGNLLYNPSKEYCDWPNEVDCGGRLIPEKDDDGDDNNDSGNGDGSNGSGNNNCDPSQAPAICAAENSDGVLIAHENCNQFYKCFEGKPVALFCQLNLLYNPAKEYCDWPYNVDCGNRVVPGGNTTNEDESGNAVVATSCLQTHDGDIVPHENCSQFFKCLSGQGYPMDCPAGLYYNTALKVCDWPMNVDCGNRLTQAQALNKHKVARRALRLLVPLP